MGDVRVGHAVLVSFGPRGSETGYVVELLDEPGFDPAKVKPLQRLLDPTPAFDERQLRFFRWVADYYLASLGMVIQTALPSGMRARTVRVAEPTDEGVQALTDGQVPEPRALVLRELIARPGLTARGLARRLEGELDAAETERALAALERKGLAAWADREIGETRARIRTVELAVPIGRALELLPRAGKRQRALIEALDRAASPVDVRVLVAEQGSTARSALATLEAAGVVRSDEREVRDALAEAEPLGPSVAPTLNDAQRAALDVLTADGAAGTYLLFGVTGSGKTEVFLGAAERTLARGRQVLVLVPEIGLTPQLVGRFKARFGETVAVLHSGLTGAERLAEWRRIRAGEAAVAVGARSALFAPFRDLGLLVVDEEHDDSYKQDEGVRYNARDLAVVLGREHNAVTVLATATPSLESWHNAKLGRYHLLQLPYRATPRPVPLVELIDMTEQPRDADGKPPIFAPECLDALRQTFAAGGQAIVLYNRRGFATMVECTACGATYECPNCGITMILHRHAAVVACHYCGLKQHYDGVCPACTRAAFQELGKGTERVEAVLADAFPEVPTARMDADTTAVRGAHHRILSDFREGRTRLLVGTQIVAKGHDFPGVQTAIVVSADHGLRIPDFRSAERTFALLVQMAGRAGRGDSPGRVLVQTWAPDHYVLKQLGGVEGFLAREARLRDALRYPPFSRLCLVRLDGVDRPQVNRAANELAEHLRREAERFPAVHVLGPAQAAMAKLVGRWRLQIVLRGEDVRAFRAYLLASRPRLERASVKGVRVSWDVDPRSLM